MPTVERADYQRYRMEDGQIVHVEGRMADKLRAIPLPDLGERSVLDVGCDMGFWSFLCANRGATRVVGIDRNRDVQGRHENLIALNREAATGTPCEFHRVDLGRQWVQFGAFDLVLMLSVYHHVFANCGDHRAIWLWLRLHTAGMLLWEGPMSNDDVVVRANVPEGLHADYTPRAILGAAREWFREEYIGPALHEPTREVWRFTPREVPGRTYLGRTVDGAGGASKAFAYNDHARAHEWASVFGWLPFAGSLNIRLAEPFDWDRGYLRAQLHDVADRAQGLGGEWRPRWGRAYPLSVDGRPGYGWRFEGEAYPEDFLEVIAPERLRDHVGDQVAVEAWHGGNH